MGQPISQFLSNVSSSLDAQEMLYMGWPISQFSSDVSSSLNTLEMLYMGWPKVLEHPFRVV